MVKNIFYLLICILSFTNGEIMAQSSQKKTVLDFTPKVPQQVINLALERVKQKEVACYVNGTIQKKKYKIVNYTTSVSVDVKYNVWFEVVDPCSDIVKKLWIQYKETKDRQYVCIFYAIIAYITCPRKENGSFEGGAIALYIIVPVVVLAIYIICNN